MRQIGLTLLVAIQFQIGPREIRSAEEGPAAIVRKAQTLRLNDRPEEAVAILETLISSGTPSAAAIDQYILSLCDQHSGDALSSKIDELEKRFGTTAAIHAARADFASASSDAGALAEVERGLKAFPDSESLVALKGYFLTYENPAEGLAWLLEGAGRLPESPIIQYHLGTAHLEATDYEDPAGDAEKAFQRASELNPDWVDPLSELLALKLREGEHDAAFEFAVRAEKLDPESLSLKRYKLQAVAMMEDPPSKPADVWREIDAILDKHGRTQRDLSSALLIARTRQIQDEKREAALVDEILKRFPDSPGAAAERRMALVRNGFELREAGKTAEAEAALRRALDDPAIGPEEIRILELLAQTVREDRAKLLPVLERLAAAVEKPAAGSQTQAPLRLARLYLSAGEHEKAIAWAKRGKERSADEAATRGMPKDYKDFVAAQSDSILAEAYMKAGRLEEAKQALNVLLLDEDWELGARRKLGLIAIQEKDWPAAQELLDAAFIQSFHGSEVEAELKQLYVAQRGSDRGWEQHIAKVKESTRAALRAEALRSSAVEPKPLPAFELSVLGTGRKISNKDIAGKITIINLWATWCGPCVQEMPDLQKFYDKHSKDARLSILSINAGEPAEHVSEFLKEKPFSIPILLDPKGLERFGVEGIPSTFVTDTTGRILYQVTGYNPEVQLPEFLEWLLEATLAATGKGSS